MMISGLRMGLATQVRGPVGEVWVVGVVRPVGRRGVRRVRVLRTMSGRVGENMAVGLGWCDNIRCGDEVEMERV